VSQLAAQENQRTADWLAGNWGGEMGGSVRALDWSTTPLGPAAGWPQSLRVAVGICLNSRFPMFVWWGPTLTNIYNDAYGPILGKRHPAALGRNAQDIWGEIWPVVGPQADLVMLRGEATWNERVLLVMERNGYTEETYFTWSYSPIIDEAGTIRGLFCACTEETEHVRAEARDRLLVAIDDAVRSLTDPAEVTATAARLLGEHLVVNRCAYADVEADQDTFNLTGDYNRGVPSIVGLYTFTDFGQEVLRLMREDRPYVVEDVDTHRPDVGDLTYYRQTRIRAVICVPLHKAGKFVAAMAVHQTTPRKWTADEVELVRQVAARCWESIERVRVERTLRESEERFRAAFEHAAVGIALVGLDGRWLRVNRKLCDLLGYSHDELLGLTFQDVTHPDDLGQDMDHVRRLTAGEEQTFAMEKRYVCKAGHVVWTNLTVAIVGDGPARHFVSVIEDITERKRFERERERLLASERDARAEAERASRMKDEFLATLSHELRTPLNAILGWAQVLRGGGDDGSVSEDVREGLDIIERNARAQTQIIEDLLDMSRIISGKIRLDVLRVDLAESVRAAIQTVTPAADARGVRLRAVLDPLAAHVSGDPGRLQQVFWNLLTNAVKFTPRGGQVQVLLERVNSHVEVSVTDTGEGIASEFLPYVFDRFRQADASTTRRHGGLGLGLAIVKQLVELHGGSVRARSPGRGGGATFVVSLPLTVLHPEPEGDGEPRRHPSAGAAMPADTCARVAGLKVLVVDDEPDARTLVKRLLEECEAVVTTAASAAEALERVQAERPDVLVSDIGMPGEDGYSLMRRVRALPADRGGETPAVALTAYARPEDRIKAVLAGFQHHVTKPAEPVELITMVASLAGRITA
jgi:PAS domain S-box-containing protein